MHRKHRAIASWLVMLLLAMVMTEANARQELEVTLTHPASTIEAESGIVVFIIKNKGTETLVMPVQLTPGSAPEGRLMGAFIDIANAAGEKAAYIGSFYKIIPDKNDPSHLFTRIEPGQTLRRKVNLALDYDLKAGGVYQVSYKQHYGDLDVMARQGYAKNYVVSNTLSIWANASLINGIDACPTAPGDRPAPHAPAIPPARNTPAAGCRWYSAPPRR